MEKRLSALNYALKLLSYRGRSERELINRLSIKGYTDEDIRKSLEELKDMGLIDDRKTALDFKNYAKETKKLGSMGIRNFLLSRGISVDVIEEICNDNDEEEDAYKLIQKRIRNLEDEKAKKRIYSLLQRRGYSFETISKVLKRFYNEEVS